MRKTAISFPPFFFYSSEHAAHMAHWPVKKSKAVLTGLWKLCARMLRRIVSDTLSDTVSDAWAVGVMRQELPHDCTISSTTGRGNSCGTSCGSLGVLFQWFLSDILEYTPGFQMMFREGLDACEEVVL
jgi:hypothetical protein